MHETLERRREAANACLHAAELLGSSAGTMPMRCSCSRRASTSIRACGGRGASHSATDAAWRVARCAPSVFVSIRGAVWDLDPEAGPRLNTEPDGDVKGELGHASSMQAFRADDDSGFDVP